MLLDRALLRLGAARPVEPVIEANNDRVQIGAYAGRRNEIEIVVLAAKVVEIIFDLAGEIFHEPKFDAGADSESGAVVGEDLSCGSNTPASGKKILGIGNAHPSPAALGIKQ